MSNEMQSTKKCSVSAVPSFVGHGVYSVSKIVPEFMKVGFTKTNSYLEKMEETFWVINSKDRFCGGGMNYRQKFLLEKANRRC